LITLQAGPTSNLDWELDAEQKGTYYLDFGWETINPFDFATFNSRLLAVEEFAKRLPQAEKVVLARIDGDFSKLIEQTEKLDLICQESNVSPELVCADLFSQYLHRLASALGDETTPAIIVDISDTEKIPDLMLLFCRRRFEHFELIFSTIALPIEGSQNVIISLPQDEKYQPSTFGPLFAGLSCKCIPEELLNEHWDEVDAIIVDPDTLGPAGMRMLYGFDAAGGLIVSTRGPLGFSNETSLEEFRSRGI
jgi:hypothetical protein